MSRLSKKVKNLIPPSGRAFLRKALNTSLDTLDSILGRRDPMIPPRRMTFVGNGDFRKIGDEFRTYFVELCGLKPEYNVLDVGCGIGRMAVPLTEFLREGSYHGFDIVPQGVAWCQERISPKFPNFQFQLVDVYNKTYNPEGKLQPSEFSFPYRDASFDFVFLTSIFTHMLPRDVVHYLSEISRVLRNKGRCLMTYFLLNTESTSLIAAGKSTQNFMHDVGGCLVVNPERPEDAVAFEESYIRDLCSRKGLNLIEPIHFGSWCGRQNFLSYQDIIVAGKK